MQITIECSSLFPGAQDHSNNTHKNKFSTPYLKVPQKHKSEYPSPLKFLTLDIVIIVYPYTSPWKNHSVGAF